MDLSISFDETEKDVFHTRINDGCKLNIREHPGELSTEQIFSATSHNERTLRNSLFYIDTAVIKYTFMHNSNGIELKCPARKRIYILTKEAHDAAFDKFTKNRA